MRKNNYLALITALLFLSCFGNKKSAVENVQLQLEEQYLDEDIQLSLQKKELVSGFLQGLAEMTAEEEIDAISNYITKNERQITEYNARIIFISKANFGIPGGDNWIVWLSSQVLVVYAINDSGIVKRYTSTGFSLEEESRFDIMRDIPGTRIGNLASSFGDFNGDGIDEIFEYGFYASTSEIIIQGYNAEKDDFVDFCRTIYKLIDRENGPAPVEFMTYNGMYGFKVYYFEYDPTYRSKNPRHNKWFFYTWDAEQREYIEVGEVE